MDSKKEVQHVYLVGAKSLGAYGGYETFVYKLTEYHQNKENIKYHVACKAKRMMGILQFVIQYIVIRMRKLFLSRKLLCVFIKRKMQS